MKKSRKGGDRDNLSINAILNVYISDCIRMYRFELYMHTLLEVERNACTTRYNNRNRN